MKIPVVFCIDANYVLQLSVVISSIVKKSKNEFEFIVLVNNVQDGDIDLIRATLRGLPKKHSLSVIKYSEELGCCRNSFLNKNQTYNYISNVTFFRLCISDILKNYNKVIYLDSDVLVLDELEELYNINIENLYAAGVKDPYVTSEKVLNENVTGKFNCVCREYLRNVLHVDENNYFNAGVLLLNLEKMRSDNITEKLISFCQKYSPLNYQDQDVLNSIFYRKFKFIDERWNAFVGRVFQDQRNAILENKTNRSTYSIVHFCGKEKPWNTRNPAYPYLSLWIDLYRKIMPKFDQDLTKKINQLKKESNKAYVRLLSPLGVLLFFGKINGHLELIIFNRKIFSKKIVFEGINLGA